MDDCHQDILAFRRNDEPDEEKSSPGVPSGGSLDAGQPQHDDELLGPIDQTLRFPGVAATQGPLPFAWVDLREQQPPLSVRIQLGKARIPVHEKDAALTGKIVSLDRSSQDPVEVVVDSRVVGYGQIVVVQGKLAVQLSQVIAAPLRRAA